MTAFFGCLYYAALRPEEAVALRYADCHLPDTGWGMLRLAAATPRTAAAWTNSGTSHEQRGLKHRPDGAIRMVPVPPVLAAMLSAHFASYGTAPNGQLFRGTRGGPLSESVYGRAWHSARTLALGPELAASGLARRPYDLRHAALSLWLNCGGDPAQIAARAGNSVAVLLTVYSHCIHGRDDLLNQQIGHVLGLPAGRGACPSVESQRSHRPRDGADAVRYTSVDFPPGPPTARGPRRHQRTPETAIPAAVIYPAQSNIRTRSELRLGAQSGPRLAQRPSQTVREPLATDAKAGAAIQWHRL